MIDSQRFKEVAYSVFTEVKEKRDNFRMRFKNKVKSSSWDTLNLTKDEFYQAMDDITMKVSSLSRAHRDCVIYCMAEAVSKLSKEQEKYE